MSLKNRVKCKLGFHELRQYNGPMRIFNPNQGYCIHCGKDVFIDTDDLR